MNIFGVLGPPPTLLRSSFKLMIYLKKLGNMAHTLCLLPAKTTLNPGKPSVVSAHSIHSKK